MKRWKRSNCDSGFEKPRFPYSCGAQDLGEGDLESSGSSGARVLPEVWGRHQTGQRDSGACWREGPRVSPPGQEPWEAVRGAGDAMSLGSASACLAPIAMTKARN